jgi:hypothetical protein
MPELTGLTDEQMKKFDKGMDAIIELRAVVLGVDGRGGLVKDMEETRSEVKLAVKEMYFNTNEGKKDVAVLLNDVVTMKPKVEKVYKAIFGNGDIGLCEKADTTRKMVIAMFGISASILLALIGLFIQHVAS